jgi:hypothetical protein
MGTAWYADSGGQVPPDIANVEFFNNLYNDGGLWHINGVVYHSLPEVLAIGKEGGLGVYNPGDKYNRHREATVLPDNPW